MNYVSPKYSLALFYTSLLNPFRDLYVKKQKKLLFLPLNFFTPDSKARLLTITTLPP